LQTSWKGSSTHNTTQLGKPHGYWQENRTPYFAQKKGKPKVAGWGSEEGKWLDPGDCSTAGRCVCARTPISGLQKTNRMTAAQQYRQKREQEKLKNSPHSTMAISGYQRYPTQSKQGDQRAGNVSTCAKKKRNKATLIAAAR
jgi:hypothetical protein